MTTEGTMPGNAELIERGSKAQLANYRPAPVVFVKGDGCRLEDADGRSFLDLSAGIAVTCIGHAHPTLARAISEQASKLLHVSNLFYNDRAVELADALVSRTQFERVYFCNSGAEANETLLKLARHHWHGLGEKRHQVVSTLGSFHGRTMGALTLTGQLKYHEGMGPMVGGVEHVPYGDLAAMEAVVGSETAAVLVEPLQAEGGLHVPPEGYLAGLRALCDRTGALLLFDEVQTGYGRTGAFLASEGAGVVPDACSLAKGIAGGFPLGAVLVKDRCAGALPPGTHATTFGGNALACAAGMAVLEVFEQEDVLANVASRGAQLGSRCERAVAQYAAAAEARGAGLLRGIRLADTVQPAEVMGALREHGVLVTLAGGNVLRISPPLTISSEELDEGMDVVDRVLAGAQ